jgi:5'-deoxynucleotidase
MPSPFYAYLSRLKHIQRWSLMRNSDRENVMEHSWMVSVIAHGIAMIHNESSDVPVEEGNIVLCALYHDVTEVLTGDLPTPIKYHNSTIKNAFGEIEHLAAERLISHVPKAQKSEFSKWIGPQEDHLEHQIVKAADRISAWLKCVEERRVGNLEFSHAETSLKREIDDISLDCVGKWMELYASTFELSLDELELLEKRNANSESKT